MVDPGALTEPPGPKIVRVWASARWFRAATPAATTAKRTRSRLAVNNALPRLEHFQVKWIRFTVENASQTKARANSIAMETALASTIGPRRPASRTSPVLERRQRGGLLSAMQLEQGLDSAEPESKRRSRCVEGIRGYRAFSDTLTDTRQACRRSANISNFGKAGNPISGRPFLAQRSQSLQAWLWWPVVQHDFQEKSAVFEVVARVVSTALLARL